MLLRLGEFAGSLVKLFLEVGCHRCAIRRCMAAMPPTQSM
jgi:hypothetical protein